MQTKFIQVAPSDSSIQNAFKQNLSLKRFKSVLEEQMESQSSEKSAFYSLVLERIKAKELEFGAFSLDNFQSFENELFLIYNLLTPNLGVEEDYLWAIGMPSPGTVIYGTDAFYKLVDNDQICMDSLQDQEKIDQSKQQFYSFILERLYEFPKLLSDPIYYSMPDPETGFMKHYQVIIDSRFLDIHVPGNLPVIQYDALKNQANVNKINWDILQKLLPLGHFEFDGFTIIRLKDVTLEYEIKNIQELIMSLNSQNPESYFSKIDNAIKSLIHKSNVFYSIFPIFKLNGIPVLKSGFAKNSILFNILQVGEVSSQQEVHEFTLAYLKNPYPIVYQVTEEISNTDSPIVERIAFLGFSSYICIPLFYNNHLTGMLEVYTKDGTRLDKEILIKLKAISGLLGQLSYDLKIEFNSRVDAVILDKFTSLQPAVQWKFNEVAAHYLRDMKTELDPIQFKDVHPLYGAIDVRNSTRIRNKAVREDLENYLGLLDNLIKKLVHWSPLLATQEILQSAEFWRQELMNNEIEDVIIKLISFFDKDVPKFLDFFRFQGPNFQEAIEEFEANADYHTGLAFEKRRAYENSLKLINEAIGKNLNQFNNELQEVYPSYFEKFRTDGIEYDVYLGQSISPRVPFSEEKLSAIRYLQLLWMVRIAQACEAQLPLMETPMITTQLIYLNPTTIDISFRTDERRFDVEGSYNIRYQVIKKRIDKIKIRNTEERLTQPHTIAIVFSSSEQIDAYYEYINTLQGLDLITDRVEKLDLEDVQGISGLKAIRLEVKKLSPAS